MTPTDPKPGDLAIFVRAENVEVRCDSDLHHAAEAWQGITTPDPCPQCHGSGTRTVTLAGWVALEFGNDDYILAKGVKKYIDRISSWLHWRDNPEDIERNIAQALHDNTCPDAIRAQLHEVQP